MIYRYAMDMHAIARGTAQLELWFLAIMKKTKSPWSKRKILYMQAIKC